MTEPLPFDGNANRSTIPIESNTKHRRATATATGPTNILNTYNTLGTDFSFVFSMFLMGDMMNVLKMRCSRAGMSRMPVTGRSRSETRTGSPEFMFASIVHLVSMFCFSISVFGCPRRRVLVVFIAVNEPRSASSWGYCFQLCVYLICFMFVSFSDVLRPSSNRP